MRRAVSLLAFSLSHTLSLSLSHSLSSLLLDFSSWTITVARSRFIRDPFLGSLLGSRLFSSFFVIAEEPLSTLTNYGRTPRHFPGTDIHKAAARVRSVEFANYFFHRVRETLDLLSLVAPTTVETWRNRQIVFVSYEPSSYGHEHAPGMEDRS